MEEKSNLFSYTFEQSALDKIYWRNTPNDNRVKIEDKECEKFPYSAIGFIELIFDSVVSYRTGILIGENIVLTAGHNLYDYRKNPIKINEKLGSPKKIYFYPGLNGNKSKYKKFESETFYYPKDFPNKSDEDYGVIIFKENISKIVGGHFELKIYNENENYPEIFTTAGYPMNRSINNNTVFFLYEGRGKIIKINNEKGIFCHEIKASYGQSGAGLCYFDKENNKYCVIGVHVASNAFNDNESYSTIITKKRYNNIKKFIESLS